MSIKPAGEDYLEAILHLSQKQEYVRSIDVAKTLKLSKPSVSVYLRKLKSEGFLDIDTNGHITLTSSGIDIANKISERHNILAQMFINLGIPEDIAFEDACKIEHDISDITFNAIRERYNSSRK